MKAISLALNDFNFIVNPFHTTCRDRKLTVVNNAIGISLQHFGQRNNSPYSTFISQRTPMLNSFFRPFGILISLQLFKVILKDINRGDGFIKLKERYKLRSFFLKQLLFIFEQKAFASLNDFFTFFISLSVFSITNLVYHLPSFRSTRDGSRSWND